MVCISCTAFYNIFDAMRLQMQAFELLAEQSSCVCSSSSAVLMKRSKLPMKTVNGTLDEHRVLMISHAT